MYHQQIKLKAFLTIQFSLREFLIARLKRDLGVDLNVGFGLVGFGFFFSYWRIGIVDGSWIPLKKNNKNTELRENLKQKLSP